MQFSNTCQKSVLITQIVQTHTLSGKPTPLAPISLSPEPELAAEILAEMFLGTQVSIWQHLQDNFSLRVKHLGLL